MDEKQELISIVVPVYNAGNYLDACVQSLLLQDYPETEILLVDDGSTDDSGNRCDRFSVQDGRIRVFHQKNRGQGAARNAGVREARGNWILFADSDDLVLPAYVSDLYRIASLTGTEIAVTDLVKKTDPEMEEIRKRLDLNSVEKGTGMHRDRTPEVCVYTSEEAICRMWYQKEISNSPCAKLFRRDLFDHQMFPEDTLYEDLACMYLLFAQTDRISVSPITDYCYRIHSGSTMTSSYHERKMDRVRVSRQILDWAMEPPAKSAALVKAAQERFFLSNVQVLREIPFRKQYRKELHYLRDNIAATRKSVLTNQEVKPGNRVIAAASYLGLPVLKGLGNCYTWFRKEGQA